MKLRIANYNISGGFFNKDDKTEYLDKERVDSVDDELLNQIIDTINEQDIDVICFEEIITTERIQYIKKICDGTSLKNYEFYELSECNIVKDTNCGIAVLSKYPLEVVRKGLFPNPGLTKTTKSGKTYHLYDKGYMIVNIRVNNSTVKLLTHHGFPYETFGSKAEDNAFVFDFFDEVIYNSNPDVIIGDFNAENFMLLMKSTNENYFRTVDKPTNEKGSKIDDILLRNNSAYSSKVLKLLSDHYMIICDAAF